MRPTHRKIPGSNTFYGLVTSDGRPVWICPHSHQTRKKANACARRHLKRLPRSGPAALRLLRESWQPQEVSVPTDETDGRPVLRRSFVEDFLQCVQHVPDGGPDAEWGGVIHDAIYRYWQLCVATREESRLGDVDRIVREAYFRQGAAPEPDRYEEARELVYGFVSSRTLELSRLLVVERQPAIEFTLRADNGWCWLVGTADRIDRTDGEDPDDPPRIVRIRDYKTGWQAAGGKLLDGAPSNGSSQVVPHDFQRRFYACLAFNDARLGQDLVAVETEIDHVRYHGYPEVITYERGELDDWWRDVRWALSQRWQNRNAAPTGCAACEHCAIRRECAAASSASRGIPADLLEARAVIEEWTRVKHRAKALRDDLAAFLRERDPILVNGLEVGFLRPRKAAWRAGRDRTLDIVGMLNQAGLAGDRAMFTAIDPAMVPDALKAPMVEAGVARWDPGAATFKSRKAGTEEEV